MKPRVLFVDDERNVLDALRRQLRKEFEVHVAESGSQALELLEQRGPFPVVVSDMRMPEMDGATLVSEIRRVAPDTVRMILSGQSDLEAAIAAVNEGHIFRFLTKPCPLPQWTEAINSGLEMNRLILAERELLESTLSGAVGVLTELLGVVNPDAFSKAARVRQCAEEMATMLQLDATWQIRVASLLSQVGCVSLPNETLARVEAGQELSEAEQEMWSTHPQLAARLLSKIPRLETVARMIGGQLEGPELVELPEALPDWPIEVLGSQILRAANEFDRVRARGVPRVQALQQMEDAEPGFHPGLIDLLRRVESYGERAESRVVDVAGLTPRMLLDEDVMTRNGLRIAPKGIEITETVLARLKNFASGVGVVEPFRVLVPC
ncbi:MAG: response regulator [bacterium]|nr:response regulator [bacterium]